MINYIKIVVLVAFLITGLSACKAESQNAEDIGYSVNSPSDTGGASEPGTWGTDYTKALAAVKGTNKHVLINFTGSDWCIWCKRLSKEVFTQQPFIDYAKENLVLLTMDFPQKIKQTEEMKKQNDALAKQYNIEGFPTLVILDKNGKEINRASYQEGGAEKYVEYLKGLMK